MAGDQRVEDLVTQVGQLGEIDVVTPADGLLDRLRRRGQAGVRLDQRPGRLNVAGQTGELKLIGDGEAVALGDRGADEQPVGAGGGAGRPRELLDLHHLGDEGVGAIDPVGQPFGQVLHGVDQGIVGRHPRGAQAGRALVAGQGQGGVDLAPDLDEAVARLVYLPYPMRGPVVGVAVQARQGAVQRLAGLAADGLDVVQGLGVGGRGGGQGGVHRASLDTDVLKGGEKIAGDADGGDDLLGALPAFEGMVGRHGEADDQDHGHQTGRGQQQKADGHQPLHAPASPTTEPRLPHRAQSNVGALTRI